MDTECRCTNSGSGCKCGPEVPAAERCPCGNSCKCGPSCKGICKRINLKSHLTENQHSQSPSSNDTSKFENEVSNYFGCDAICNTDPYSRDNPTGEVIPCEYDTLDGSTFTVTCPNDESGTPYTCDEGPNDAPWSLRNNGQTGNFTFCDIPYNLTQLDACAVFNATGSEIQDVAGMVCDTGVSCDAGPVEYTDDGEVLDLYFCGSVPTGPNYLRKLLDNYCELENSTGVIDTKKCDERYGWACTYGPIDVVDSYGFFGTYSETLSLSFCEPTGGLTDPLDIFYNRRRDGTRNTKAGVGGGKGKGKARGK